MAEYVALPATPRVPCRFCGGDTIPPQLERNEENFYCEPCGNDTREDEVAVLPEPHEITVPGVKVLLVYGAHIKVATADQPGIRVTAGYHDGSVLLEAVGFPDRCAAVEATQEAATACLDAGLIVGAAPHRMSNYPARVVFRRRP